MPEITFDHVPPGTKFHSDAEIILKLRFIKDNLPFWKVYAHYGWTWGSKETHQMSCPFHASKRDGRGQPYEGHPSARYYAHDRSIWCFACSEGGDVSWFIRKKENHQNYGSTVDYVKCIFNVALNDTDLQQRIRLYSANQEPVEASRRQIVSEMYSDKVNDEFYKLRQMGRNDPQSQFCQIADRLEKEVFRKKTELETCEADYIGYTRQLRRWFDWTQELIVSALKLTAAAAKR